MLHLSGTESKLMKKNTIKYQEKQQNNRDGRNIQKEEKKNTQNSHTKKIAQMKITNNERFESLQIDSIYYHQSHLRPHHCHHLQSLDRAAKL